MEGTATQQRSTTADLARSVMNKAGQLEKMSSNAADAIDHSTPRPIGEAKTIEGSLVNDILRSALRKLNRVEENLNELQLRIGNPHAERASRLSQEEIG